MAKIRIASQPPAPGPEPETPEPTDDDETVEPDAVEERPARPVRRIIPPTNHPTGNGAIPRQAGHEIEPAAGKAIQDVTTLTRGIVNENLRKAGPTKGVMKWIDEHEDLVAFIKGILINLGGAIDRHSERMAAIQRQRLALEVQQRQAQPAAPTLAPFETLPLEQRIEWCKRGGRDAYLQHGGVGRPTTPGAMPTVTLLPPQIPTVSVVSPAPSAAVKSTNFSNGQQGLLEARLALGLAPQTAAPPAVHLAPTPAPAHPTTTHALPQSVVTFPRDESADRGVLNPDAPHGRVDGEEILPSEFRGLPKVEKEALLLADQIVKEEHANLFVSTVDRIPEGQLTLFAQRGELLVSKRVNEIESLVPDAYRAKAMWPMVRGMLVTDLLGFVPENVKRLYLSIDPAEMTTLIRARLAHKPELQDPAVVAWLQQNIAGFQDLLRTSK